MDYSDQEIDQLVDEILTDEKAEPMEARVCVRCHRVFQAKAKSTKKYCPECLTAIRQFGGRKSKRSQSAAAPAAKPSPTIFSGDPQSQERAAGGVGPCGSTGQESEALTVGKLLELLGSVPRDAVIREVTVVELRSIWELEHGQRTELYFRRRGEL
jgi:predicted RNA-binding Zn-ribbon protein involved in translation (DUF1610 family)